MTCESVILPVRVAAQQNDYRVHVGHGLLAQLGSLMAQVGLRRGPVALVSNATVAAHWLAPAQASLLAAGYLPHVCEVPDGERFKTLETVSGLYGRFLEGGLDRGSAVVALGGGVVGDMAGFAAASFLRGMPFVQVPTSLLAMVDASVGGKTGVDLAQGKNLVGAFKQPALVLADPQVLSTLAPQEFRSGLAEVVKHGVLHGESLFGALESAAPTPAGGLSSELLARVIAVKIEVVEEDPFEAGRRATLNLGHTFGHAIEQVSGYRVRHGEAVAIGMVMAARLGRLLGRCDEALETRLRALLERLGLPVAWSGAPPEALLAAMGTDKKREAGRLRFIVPEAIGRVVVVDAVPEARVLGALG